MQLDEGEGQEEEGATEGAVEQQGQEIDPAEHRRAKQLRAASSGFGLRRSCHRKPARRTMPSSQRRQHKTIPPAAVRMQRSGHRRGWRGRRRPAACPASRDAACAIASRLSGICRMAIQSVGKRQNRIDQEDHPPGPVIDEPAAEERPQPRGNGGGARPDADGPAALALREGRADEGERAGNQQRAHPGPGRCAPRSAWRRSRRARSRGRSPRRWRFRSRRSCAGRTGRPRHPRSAAERPNSRV